MHYTVRGGDTLSKIAAAHGTTLQLLLDANPQYRPNPGLIHVGDVILIPNGSAPAPAHRDRLGGLSSRYETSGRGPGTVSTGRGDAGGVSYGSYQMTSQPGGGTVARFIAAPDFLWRARFVGLTPGTEPFSAQWRALAAAEPDAFFAAQHGYIRRTHYDPLVGRIALDVGLDVTARSHALQDVVWSTAVHHGPNTPVVHRAIAAQRGGSLPDDRALIVAIYAERGRRAPDGTLLYFRRNSIRVQDSVAARFVNEQRDALAMLERETA